jgi:uncharacterized protein (TIGR02145 family)
MPTAAEFGNAADYSAMVSGSLDDANVAGAALLSAQAGRSRQGVFFPASGSRGSGTLNGVGTYGSYWSASAQEVDMSFFLYFNSAFVDTDFASYRRYYALPVRCVK